MPTPASPTPETERLRGVTFRAVALGTFAIPVNAFWVLRMEEVMFGPYPSLLSLFANVLFLLFVLVGLNALWRRFRPRSAFSQGELLTLYTMLTIGTGMAGQSGLNVVCSMIGHGAWFDTQENGWSQFASSFPDWLVVRDREILRGHYLGNASFYHVEILRAWIVPVLSWTLLFSLLLLIAYGINILVRRQWADHERLTFPIIWLPLEMTEGGIGQTFFRNRLMWAGFALAGGLNLWNGLAFLYPSLPSLPIGIIDLKPLITVKPWNAIGWTPMTLYPLVIGMGYLLPLDLLFSCWFFYFFWKGQLIASNALALDSMQDFPFIREQGFGAVIGLFLYYLWSGRTHYRAIWQRVRKKGDKSRAGEEGISERAALWIIGAASLGLLAFGLAAHVTGWVILVFFALYIATLVVVTRIRAELGAPIHDFTFMGPDTMLTRALGTGAFRQTDLAFFSYCYPLTYSRSNDTMPIALESQQMARLRHLDMRRMFGVLLFSTLFGTLCAFWAYEHQAYQLGASAKWYAGTHFGQEAYEKMSAWAGGGLNPRPNPTGTLALGVGFLTTLGLMALRLRFFGFPLHPIGYAVSSAWAINIVWLPLFIAWVCKGLVMRYGGLRIYRMLLPFFLGLILGDCVMGSAWGLLSLLLNMRTYNFFGV